MTANYFGRLQVYNADPDDSWWAVGYSDVTSDGQYIFFCPYDKGEENGIVLRYNTAKPFYDDSAWTSFDAGNIDGLNTKNYFGLVFDGRFLYFVPSDCRTSPYSHCRVLRYDTRAPFDLASAWSAYDAAETDGLVCRGYRGAVFDGRFVYFVPHINDGMSGDGFHAVFLRYDTRAPFKDSSSWAAYDAGAFGGLGYWGGVLSGDYIYFSPFNRIANNGRVLRYNYSMPFKDPNAWSVIDLEAINPIAANFGTPAADKNYIYFPPGQWVWIEGYELAVARYNKSLPFDDPSAWEIMELQSLEPYPEAHGCAFFYGQYILFGPYEFDLLAYDSHLPFTNPAAWTVADVGFSNGIMGTTGYRGVCADNQYFYFAPYYSDMWGFSGLCMRCKVEPCINQVQPVPGNEDLTKYYVEPEDGTWTITEDKLILADVPDEWREWYMYRCYGFNAFEAVEVDFELKLVAASYDPLILDPRTVKHGTIGFSNLRRGQKKSVDYGDDDPSVQLRVDFLAGVIQHAYIQLDRLNSGTAGPNYEITLGTSYYCTMKREAGSLGTITLEIYSDAARTMLLTTLTQTGFSIDRKWRFVYITRAAAEPHSGEANACSYEVGGVEVLRS